MPAITIRELRESDLNNGFLLSLDSLRKTSDMEINAAKKIFQKINADPDHVVTVAELDGRIVGCITMWIEQKFIHKGGKVTHLEDLAVDGRYRGMKIGEMLMNNALDYSRARGCYKTILDCTNEIKPYHEKLGFVHNANALRFDHD